MLGSVADAGGVGDCVPCCILDICCPYCTLWKLGMDTAAKYSVQEGCCASCMKAFCCTLCYRMQIQHEIMYREKLHYSCGTVEKDKVEVTPQNALMGR